MRSFPTLCRVAAELADFPPLPSPGSHLVHIVQKRCLSRRCVVVRLGVRGTGASVFFCDEDTDMTIQAHDPEVRKALETCRLNTNATYQKLLEQPGAIAPCREAGKTVRHLAQCLADTDTGLEDYDDDSEEQESGVEWND
jgi:hypothetical protein